MSNFLKRLRELEEEYEHLIAKANRPAATNGVWTRYGNPVLTAAHAPVFWRYDLDRNTNPLLLERFGINSVFNAGAMKWNGRYLMAARVEGADRKSFFAIAESPNGVDNFRFWDYPVALPDTDDPETNVYDMRLTNHEDGWIYGVFCAERRNPQAAPGDLSSAVASAGIARTRDLVHWERLPDLKSPSQQRNAVLHPEFVDGRYAFYTRPQDDFITAGNGGGIGWALVEDIANAEIKEETIINHRYYHTIKELKNGEGPAPIRTAKGWLHLAHGVRMCADGFRYVLYLYLTDLVRPWELTAEPAGYFMAPIDGEGLGDVGNVLFSNGWIADDDGTVYIYYAGSDSRMYVATSTVERLLDYCLHTAPDGYRSARSVETLAALIDRNMSLDRREEKVRTAATPRSESAVRSESAAADR